jgi:cytidylate kinase
MKNLVIAVDGPAGAGKSTIAKIIAERLNINYIDTGAMYRAVTYKVLQNNIDTTDEQAIIEVAKASEIDFKDNNIYLDGKILKEEIRTPEVSNNVSNVAQIKEVRYLMVDVQREIGNRSSVILDGRDIGSYVFPNADYKFFLNASPEERGERRYKELVKKG